MFKPIRFNQLLKAVPGLTHLQHTQHSTTHKYSEHIKKTVDIDNVHVSAQTGKEVHTHAHVTEDVERKPAHGTTGAVTHEHIRADVDVVSKSVQGTAGEHGMTETLSHVHATIVGVANIELTPPHPPREETPLYVQTHRHLVFTQDSPCAICGVRRSTLNDPKANPFGAKDLETHHYPIERCLLDACDPKKVGVIFPQVKDRKTLEEFIDSEANMMVLCDIHHRHPLHGIHHLVGPDFYVQPFLYGGYQIVADAADEAAAIANNEKVVHKHVTIDEITHGDQVVEKKVVKETTVTRPVR
ncbi:hypothetical protein [Tengunoibacter tsumagoiensis]|uniref:Uncharacterized protein n=1 Tax=Tengunoibacter tsumagoiensis TaxID=2014871 RepID=A0A402A6D0_9CHLR|nr:hypothetical protein [Tengunoibacter tsumagoiensis]GCE14690.1 hypothetical protein KTT_45490 [Tengunoibacter tsumagoiensis]